MHSHDGQALHRAIFRSCLTSPTVPIPFGARSVGQYRKPAGWSEPPRRKHFFQFFWGVAGEGCFDLGSTTYALRPHQVFRYEPDEVHSFRAVSAWWEYRWFTIDGELAPATVAAFNLRQRAPWSAGRCPEELFLTLERRILDQTPAGQRMASAAAYAILCATGGPRFDITGDHDRLVGEAMRIIHADFSDPGLDIAALAARLKVHRVTLSRHFQACLAMPVGRYLAATRLREAMTLLKDTSYSIAEIAALCGYDDPGYLCRVVKSATGATPSRFRRQ